MIQTTYAGDPVTGITSLKALQPWASDELDWGIDLTWESALKDAIAEIRDEWELEGLELDDQALEDAARERLEMWENDDSEVIFGDWIKKDDGKYHALKDGPYGFAASYSNFCGGTVTVDWSKYTKLCHHTSPCFVMSDLSGPCGDLDTPGDSRLAYTLPPEWFRGEGDADDS